MVRKSHSYVMIQSKNLQQAMFQENWHIQED